MSCCSPSAEPRRPSSTGVMLARSSETPGAGMVALEGGEFLMGSGDRFAYPDDGEGPVRRVQVEPFRVDTRAMSNADYARFVEASAYVTEAERFGWSFVFGGLLPDDFSPTRGVAHAPWWRQVEGADWRRPEGPQSDIGGRDDHPVVADHLVQRVDAGGAHLDQHVAVADLWLG
jgi:formylglycine-generating enzyme